ncbi:cytochrome bc complex cytochrome b subunit, partial [Campylobacter lari]
FAIDQINFEPSDNLKTPTHIYPEWYFLWSYEVLRGIYFSADLGLIAFGIAQVVFFILPWLDRSNVVAPAHRRKGFFVWFWLLIIDLIVLTIFGKLPPEGMNTYVGFAASIGFLFLMFIALPLITIAERKKGGL